MNHVLKTLSLLVIGLLLLTTPLLADTISIYTSASSTGAAVSSPTDPRLGTGDISGLTFIPVGTDNEGSFTAVPPGAPPGTLVVQVPPECGYYCGQSGFVMVTFTLPSSFFSASLAGAGNVDDGGYAFLNGNNLGTELTEFANATFSTNNALYFLPGLNTLVVSDSNFGGGPSAVVFYADINYSSSATPEPGTLLTLGSGILGLAGLARKRLFR